MWRNPLTPGCEGTHFLPLHLLLNVSMRECISQLKFIYYSDCILVNCRPSVFLHATCFVYYSSIFVRPCVEMDTIPIGVKTCLLVIWNLFFVVYSYRSHCLDQKLLWCWIQAPVHASYLLFRNWKFTAVLLSHTTWFQSFLQSSEWSWSEMHRYVSNHIFW